ncbi:hypothetical protein MY8738_003037 [Beauveria namnaoensis]
MVHPITPSSPLCKDIRLPCYLLNSPSVNTDFCGREDVLRRLADELLPSANVAAASGTGLRQFALCGFGGIGKTEIAREFARRHKRHFDAVFWVVADEKSKLDHQYQKISLELGLEDESECKSLLVSREILKGWLSNPQSKLLASDEIGQANQAEREATWLLIFDNADDPTMLADYWPQGSGSTLVTSRDPLAKTMFTSRCAGLDLGPLSQQDGLSLFNHLTANSNTQEDETARHISNALGGIPLAISQMAGIIRRQDLTLTEFLELFIDHEERTILYETKFDSSLVTYRHSLSSVWAFEKLKPQTRKLLELISFLDPDIIGEDLLMSAFAKRGIARTQDRRYEEGEADLKEALRIRKSLGNYIPRSGEANLSWALLAQGKLEECNALLLDSLAGREKALGKEDRESVRTGLILYALGNLRAAQKEWGESFEYHRRAWRHMCATVGEKDFYTANVAHKLAEHLNRAGQRDEAIAMINLALQIWSVDQTAHLNEIARTHFLMAKVFEGAGKTQEASVALKVACGLRKEVTKVDRDVQSLRTEDFDEIVGFWAR